jgi:phosphopantothenoylcysteine synthetase/decarboxylase
MYVGGCLTYSMAVTISTVVLFWRANGLSMHEIMLLQALFAASLALFELPSGYAADLLGRKGVIAAAAPCDFEPAARVPGKIPRKGSGLSLVLEPTPDIIATLSRRARPEQWMVAFALEPGGDPRRALEKIDAKACDLIVVNDVTAIEGTRTAVTVYDRSHALVGSKAGTKRTVATWLIRLFAKRLMS